MIEVTGEFRSGSHEGGCGAQTGCLVVSLDPVCIDRVCSLAKAALGACNIQAAPDSAAALRAITQRPTALVALDARALGSELEACVASLATSAPETALMVVGELDQDREAVVLAAGAQDVLPLDGLAGYDESAAVSTLRKALIRQAVLAEARQESLRDPLTGLLNRRGLWGAADVLLGLARRSGAPALVLLLDVDNMKSINDSHGHAGGDRALVSVAQAIRAATRATDAAGRIGGDEFCVVAYAAGLCDGAAMADRIKNVLRQSAEPSLPSVTVAAGWAEVDLREEQPLRKALEQADAELYGNKRKRTSNCGAP